MAEIIDPATGAAHVSDTGAAQASEYVIMDLGRHKPKQVRQLRRGRGKLLRRVQRAINELRASGINQPIVLVVERRPQETFSMFPLPTLLPFAFADDDADDDDNDNDDDDC
jgi:hypothetical protein